MLEFLIWTGALTLAELSRFAHCPWWWQLKWGIWQEFRDLDLSAPLGSQKLEGEEFDYGETPPATLAKILEISALPQGAAFVDLGSGRGTNVMTAHHLGFRATGIELVQEFVTRSRRLSKRLNLPVNFHQADFLKCPWPSAHFYFLNSTAFPEAFRQRLSERFRALPNGTLISTFDWELTDGFEHLESLRLAVTRGTVLWSLYRVNSPHDAGPKPKQ